MHVFSCFSDQNRGANPAMFYLPPNMCSNKPPFACTQARQRFLNVLRISSCASMLAYWPVKICQPRTLSARN